MSNTGLFKTEKIKHVHFVGIGGISMSGLAKILFSLGYKISGSDENASHNTEVLESLGIKVDLGHSGQNVSGADLVVYTVAVKEDNPELVTARKLGIPVIDRATLLGRIMKMYPYSVAVSGTHGKTTTTSMVTTMMIESRLDPTVHIGGELDAIGGNIRIGGSSYFVTEACEYYESFLDFRPHVAVVLNIELDHVDYYKNMDQLKEAFRKFVGQVPREGFLVTCLDDPNAANLLESASCNKITYGLKSQDADFTARDIVFNSRGCASYTLVKAGEPVTAIRLNVPGIHNVGNSLAAIAACSALGCGIDSMARGLEKFTGIRRRFEVKGTVGDVMVVDDYAHHPSEVKATLRAARKCAGSKIWCVFQPHTYSRTKYLLDDFSESFWDADTVIVTDIYASREKDTGEIHSKALADALTAKGKDAVYISGFEAIAEYLKKNASPGDMVITMGAGDVYKVGEILLCEDSVKTAI